MRKANIFDLYEEQQKAEPKPSAPERIENEVQPADLEEEPNTPEPQPAPEIKPEPKQEETPLNDKGASSSNNEERGD